ncbi:MAG: hypothetical protein EAX91_06900 [Candidatus Lokiarchaeota archaeon]|nr:hypothetical protein [Candidatus Lokiarchaeota archaeon]
MKQEIGEGTPHQKDDMEKVIGIVAKKSSEKRNSMINYIKNIQFKKIKKRIEVLIILDFIFL